MLAPEVSESPETAALPDPLIIRPEPTPVELNAAPEAGVFDTPMFSQVASNMANATLRAENISKRLRDPAAPHRPDIELRLITPDTYPDAEEMGGVWNRIKEMSFFLDDSILNPYIFEQIITSTSTTAFLLGKPAQGIMWASAIQRGYQACVSMATWERNAWGREKEVRIAIGGVLKAHNLHRMFALVCTANKLSMRFMKRLGFTQEGLIKEGLCYSGTWYDVALMGLLARDTAAWGKKEK